MKLSEMRTRVRSLLRDFNGTIFRTQDITSYLNEGIDRMIQTIPEFSSLSHMSLDNDEPSLIPTQYHSLLTVYCSSRLSTQDERHYQATTFMNEFEHKLDELKTKIETGEIIITDPSTGEEIDNSLGSSYVYDNYFDNSSMNRDFDDGVEGVK